MTTVQTVQQRTTRYGSDGVHMVVLPQRFDVHEISRFDASIGQSVMAGAHLVVDASEVRYMDRSGMDYLIEARLRCMDNGGDLAIASPSVAARVILELSGRYEALNPVDGFDGFDGESIDDPMDVAA